MNPGKPASAPPSHIGRYRIVERIGRGAMGIVFSAHDEVMDRVVAVKVLMADLEAEPETRARFYREAQAAGRLLHPNVITIFDMGEDEGRIFIVMELLKGRTLTEYLRQPAVPLEHKVALMVQACEGLAAAHDGGIVHRDIKPGNLFVLSDGGLKILDFGIARLVSSTMTASGLVLGTPDYMSPEQARGGEIDHRSDIFSAAAVFYHMLSGRKPFAARDLPGVLLKVQSEAPAPLTEAEAPAALGHIVIRSLAKSPAHRHQSMAEFAADLARFLRHFVAETRQVAIAAREQYDAIQALLREGRDVARRLGLAEPGEPPMAASLREQYPAFVERTPELLLVPFTRFEMSAILASLGEEQAALEHAVDPNRRAAAAAADIIRALDDGRPDEAAVLLEQSSADLPETPAVAALRARAALDRAAAERAHAVERLLDEAALATRERRFDAASRAFEEAGRLEVPPELAERLTDLLDEYRRARAAAAALARREAEVISLARAELHAGHREAALAVLREFLADEPDARHVRGELARLEDRVRLLEEADQAVSRARGDAAASQDEVEQRRRAEEEQRRFEETRLQLTEETQLRAAEETHGRDAGDGRLHVAGGNEAEAPEEHRLPVEEGAARERTRLERQADAERELFDRLRREREEDTVALPATADDDTARIQATAGPAGGFFGAVAARLKRLVRR
jgi:hypothetical protein